MFSKLPWVVVICGAVFFAACSNEEISKSKDIVVNLAYDTNCFSGMEERWEMWSKGQGDEARAKADIHCIIDGISYFLLRVRGENLGFYSSQEIFNFTEKFFKTAGITKSLIDDLLIAKSWVLGGSETNISFEELNKVSWFLKTSSSSVTLLTPIADKVFFQKSPQALTDEAAINIKTSLTTLSREFKTLTASAKIPVSMHDFETVINRLFQEFNFTKLETKDIAPLWNILSITTGKPPRALLSFNPKEGLSELAFRALYIAIRFQYGIQEIGWRNINSYTHLDSVVGEILTVLKTVVGYQPQGHLTQLRLNNLAYEFLSLMDLDFEVTELWIDGILHPILNTYFKSPVFGQAEVDVLAKEWQDFRDFYSQTLVMQGLGFTGSLVGQSVLLSDLNRRALDFTWPLLSDDKGYVLNPLYDVEIMANYGNLFWVNWQRALVSVFLKAYVKDKDRRDNLLGVTLEELKTGYGDVFKVLNAIDYLADDNEGSWFRIFNEANLFVPRAKADEYMSYEEGVDFFALLFSGISFSGDLFTAMTAACPEAEKSCQLNWLKNTREATWERFAPAFTDYFKTIDKEEWNNFAEGFEQMARGTVQNKPFLKSELLRVSIAIQYIEIFLRKYDLDENLKINFVETVASFEKFKAALLALPQVKGTEAESDPATLLSLYTFFLKRGRLPRQTFGQYIELLGWRSRVNGCITQTPEGAFVASKPQACEYESSRGNLMKILAFLSNSL